MSAATAPVAVVTGAGSGIGAATALAFARHGYRVLALDVDVAAVDRTTAEIAAAGGVAASAACDVRDDSGIDAAIDYGMRTFGRIDCAFNNAGVEQRRATVAEISADDWTRTLDVNLRGMWSCVRAEVPALLSRGGAIVNCASVAALGGAAGASAYSASKHGVVGLTRSAALELASQGVRVNAVCPGFIETPMNDRVIAKEPAKLDHYRSTTPMGRMGSAAEVAEVAVWLCSDAASYVTGASIPVDGGLTAR